MGFYSNVIFPRMMNKVMDNPFMEEQRRQLLRDVSGEILEIGFGTGLNLPNYPDQVRKITVIDPNAGVRRIAQKRIDASPIEVESKMLSGENLPMEDQSFDTVVCTWTLCSIPDAEAALREVKRVLRPEGRFFFVEHGLSDNAAAVKWQNRLNTIWGKIGDGCNLNRPIDQVVQGEGFKIPALERFEMPKTPKFASHTYKGIAEIA